MNKSTQGFGIKTSSPLAKDLVTDSDKIKDFLLLYRNPGESDRLIELIKKQSVETEKEIGINPLDNLNGTVDRVLVALMTELEKE